MEKEKEKRKREKELRSAIPWDLFMSAHVCIRCICVCARYKKRSDLVTMVIYIYILMKWCGVFEYKERQ